MKVKNLSGDKLMKTWQTQDGLQVSLIVGGTVNLYLISYAQRFLLIDAGYSLNRNRLIKRLAQFQVTHKNLSAVILTHTHFDHAGNAKRVKEHYATNLVVQRNEADYLHRGETCTVHGTSPLFGFIIRSISPVMRRYHYPPTEADILVDERYDLSEWGFHGYLLHTPGHSPGSLCVILNDEVALVGDTVFNISSKSTFPPIAAEKQLIQASWTKLLDTGCHTFLPAHGGAIPRERLEKDYGKLGS